MELIVAFAENNVIGNNNTIPWHIPEDLMRFKHMTENNVIVMGRKTFESFPNGPLKNRTHIVLTNQKDNPTISNVFFTNEENLDKILEPFSGKKIFVIGGKEIYTMLIKRCETIHITLVDGEHEGNVIFPYDLHYFAKNYKLFQVSDVFVSKKNALKYQYFTFTNLNI